MIPRITLFNQAINVNDEVDKREKFIQLYFTAISIFAALQALTSETTYKVNSTNLSNILVSQISTESGSLLQIAYPMLIISIIAYYILLKTNNKSGIIINILVFVISICFSWILCSFLKLSVSNLTIQFVGILVIVFVSLQTVITVE